MKIAFKGIKKTKKDVNTLVLQTFLLIDQLRHSGH